MGLWSHAGACSRGGDRRANTPHMSGFWYVIAQAVNKEQVDGKVRQRAPRQRRMVCENCMTAYAREEV
jgi:hypothetical protein